MTDFVDFEQILDAYRHQEISLTKATEAIQAQFSEQLATVTVDHDRERRTGSAEVVYGEQKTVDQTVEAFTAVASKSKNVLGTRISSEAASKVASALEDVEYYPVSRVLQLIRDPKPQLDTSISIVTAGTSDEGVAEEAALTANFQGSPVVRCRDVGVAGIHRLLKVVPQIRTCKTVVVIAGMEGALPSVVAGLVDKPVIAVPTSVGYGASFNGLAALLAMLNSCATGVSVVNIDNGFGAGILAHRINSL